jgi:hypothetical protein
MTWYSEPLEEDMWSQEGLFKTNKEYREDLNKTRLFKYRKDPFLNSLNSSDEFEVTTSQVEDQRATRRSQGTSR